MLSYYYKSQDLSDTVTTVAGIFFCKIYVAHLALRAPNTHIR